METTKVYAYLRKSTDDQSTKSQELAVYEHANKEGLRIDQWFDVDCSSRKSTKERRIDELLGLVNEGDTLIVPELSRLDRISESGNGNTVFSFPPLDQIFFHAF